MKILPFDASSTKFISAARKSEAKSQTWTAKKNRNCILFVRFLFPVPITMSLHHIICSCWPCCYCWYSLNWHFDNLKNKNRDFTVLRFMEVVTDPEAISWISEPSWSFTPKSIFNEFKEKLGEITIPSNPTFRIFILRNLWDIFMIFLIFI